MAVQGAPAWGRLREKYPLPALLLCLALATAAPAPASARAATARPVMTIGVHSMLYLDTPLSAMKVMFQEAAAIGASEIRLDIELSAVFATPNGPPDWSGIDAYTQLAHQYHLHVLADLTATPQYMAACPPAISLAETYRCQPAIPACGASRRERSPPTPGA
jgi:hypothetical protein